MSEWVDIDTAIEATGYSRAMLYYLVRNERINARKEGSKHRGYWHIDLDDLLRYKREMDEAGDKKYGRRYDE